MPRYFCVAVLVVFIVSVLPSFAQQTFTLNHPAAPDFSGCLNQGCFGGACPAYTETWTIDRSVVFGSEIMNGTYQNTAFDGCTAQTLFNVAQEIELGGREINLPYSFGFFSGNDGPCSHPFPTDSQGSTDFGFCVQSTSSDTVHYQLQLNTADFGGSDPQSVAFVGVTDPDFSFFETTPLFNVSYIPDQSAEMGPCTQCQAQAGAPINLFTGNVWIQQQDYVLPGLGGGMELTRSWNSMWSNNRPPKQVGMFGDGWTSTYEENLSQTANGLKYWSGAGTAWTFTFNSSNSTYSLTIPSDARATLVFDSTANQYTLTLKDGNKRIFDSNGRMVELLDRNSNATTLGYDASGRLSTVTDAGGRILTFAYGDPSNVNQVTTISDAAGTIATYTYAANGILTSVAYADGSGFRFTSDPTDLITSVTDPTGKVIESHTYDSIRRGLSSAEANNVNSVTISYAANESSQITDSLGNISNYGAQVINRKHYLSSMTGFGCATCGAIPGTSYTYDSQGNVATATDAANNKTSYTYDSNANLTSSSLMVGGINISYSYTYNGFAEVLTATDPLGNVSTNTYDANGNLLSTTTPSPGGKTAGSKTSFAYDAKGELTQITDPLKNITKIAYTPAGLISTITDSLGNVTSYGYDTRGNRTSVSDALKNQTTFQYDSRNRLTKITRPDQSTVRYGYDLKGRRTSVTDENNKVTQYGYDDADRLISVTGPDQAVTQYAYDTEGNLSSITDPLLHTTTFSYDSQRRLTQTTFPSTKSESYSYDAVSDLATKTDRKGQTITYSYDELRRLTKKQYPDTTTVNYTYDAASRLTQAQDSTGTYTFTYDNMGRLTQASEVYAFLTGKTFSVSYAYDAGSNRTGLTDPNGSNISYSYDALNRLTSIKDFNRNSFGFGFDALSRRTSLTRPNAVNTSYQYDSVSNLLSVLHNKSTTTLDGTVYTYDAAGNRTSKANKLNSVTSSFGYDSLYQLTGVTQGTSTVESYTFDAAGNRTSSATIPTYTYDASNELQSTGASTYAYDANGNTISKTDASGTTTYSWDFENRLTSVVLPGGNSVTFVYDPLGRRIRKSDAIYVYDGINLIQESDSAGNLVARYVHGPGVDEPLVAYRGSATEFFEGDGLGSITSLSSTAGAVNQTYVFDSFGNTTATTGTFVQPFRYTGREFDNETGLYLYRARYYDPSIGRFLNEDSRRNAVELNRYAYALNNPVLLRDPRGHQEEGDPAEQEAEEAIEERNREREALKPAEPEPPLPETWVESVYKRHSPSDIQAVRNGACSTDPELEKAIKIDEAFNRIKNGGPYPYTQDATIFRNREGNLPDKPYGYYHEYTVEDPSAPNRGTRRIVVGDNGEMYYTDNHYQTFIQIK